MQLSGKALACAFLLISCAVMFHGPRAQAQSIDESYQRALKELAAEGIAPVPSPSFVRKLRFPTPSESRHPLVAQPFAARSGTSVRGVVAPAAAVIERNCPSTGSYWKTSPLSIL